ncbi:hypothetical protein [Acaryochloris sp. CCMEE 5410]|uniref:hypothetical protein n=1 Tax=Acaryochloris sp. CCMEE 5410 TaxID=310037 RepID=UPI0002483A68|nr:hypothetical protein [Acaryochloris sp. CCMEE 5410]KAI9129429.1 hypothetical protein ON05_035560 [Acaryochloris sp. CCMEE 5410]
MTNLNSQASDISPEIAALKMQLAISLKFHHRSKLERLPLEAAVRVMAEVWDACDQQRNN